jgi:Mn2+/Fe2+ NRAMP family transporter
MINDPNVMGEHVNGRVRNVIAWGFTISLIAMSALLLLSPLLT